MNEIKIKDSHKKRSHVLSPLPHTYLVQDAIPDNFSWARVDGKSYLTKQLNQHIPHYCGSCWAHGAISSLMDRIKIARKGQGVDINLSIQYMLNCGAETAGSCHGGYHTGTFEVIKQKGFIPYETCQPYLACSAESEEGFCPHIDTTCSPVNTCRTCSGFSDKGGQCVELNYFPNATIAEYGEIGTGFRSMLDTQASRVRSSKGVRWPVPSTPTPLGIMKVAFSTTTPPPPVPTTLCPLLVSARTTPPVRSTGSFGTAGENIGGKWDLPRSPWGRT